VIKLVDYRGINAMGWLDIRIVPVGFGAGKKLYSVLFCDVNEVSNKPGFCLIVWIIHFYAGPFSEDYQVGFDFAIIDREIEVAPVHEAFDL